MKELYYDFNNVSLKLPNDYEVNDITGLKVTKTYRETYQCELRTSSAKEPFTIEMANSGEVANLIMALHQDDIDDQINIKPCVSVIGAYYFEEDYNGDGDADFYEAWNNIVSNIKKINVNQRINTFNLYTKGDAVRTIVYRGKFYYYNRLIIEKKNNYFSIKFFRNNILVCTDSFQRNLEEVAYCFGAFCITENAIHVEHEAFPTKNVAKTNLDIIKQLFGECSSPRKENNEIITNTENNNVKENKMDNLGIINAALTFDKELAFPIEGKYMAVDKTGRVKEILPAFILAKDIPALIPTVADKITVGTFYSTNNTLYKAIADNKVIDLKTGLIGEIAIATIPMTDKIVVYKPLVGNTAGKTGIKDILKMQMIAKMGQGNPLMVMAMLGENDMNMKDILLMQMMNGKGDTNNLLPLLLLDDKNDMDMKDILLMQMMNGNQKDMNALLPLLLLGDKGKKADMFETVLLMQAMNGKGDANALLPLLLLKKDKEEKPTEPANN